MCISTGGISIQHRVQRYTNQSYKTSVECVTHSRSLYSRLLFNNATIYTSRMQDKRLPSPLMRAQPTPRPASKKPVRIPRASRPKKPSLSIIVILQQVLSNDYLRLFQTIAHPQWRARININVAFNLALSMQGKGRRETA